MKNDILEIRWHGRGGQGAKTVALLFAQAVMTTGKYIQAFPEYGPERMGAPVQSFNRISDMPITLHCGVESPSVVAVLDPTLMGKVNVTQGLTDGSIIINTPQTPREIRAQLGLKGSRVFTVNASKIAQECIGRPIPNTPMMGAVVKVTGFLNLKAVLDDTRRKLEQKFHNKPEVIDGNIKSIERAYQEVQGE